MIIEFICENLERVSLPDVNGELLYQYAVTDGTSDMFDEAVQQFVIAAGNAYAGEDGYSDLQYVTAITGLTYPNMLRQPAELALEDYNDLTISAYASWEDNLVLDRYKLRRLIVEDIKWPSDDIARLELALGLDQGDRFSPVMEQFLLHASACFIGLENNNLEKAQTEAAAAQEQLTSFNTTLGGLQTHIQQNQVTSGFIALEQSASFASQAMNQLMTGLATVYQKVTS